MSPFLMNVMRWKFRTYYKHQETWRDTKRGWTLHQIAQRQSKQSAHQHLAEYQQKISQEVISDDEIVYRIGEIERISAILPRLNLLSFQHRRRLIELLNITIILGVDDERQYVEMLWYGDSERRWLYDEAQDQQLDLHPSG